MPLSITSLTPDSGKAGDHVIINGTELDSVVSVQFAGIPVQFNHDNDTELEAVAPSGGKTGYVVVASETEIATFLTPFAYEELGVLGQMRERLKIDAQIGHTETFTDNVLDDYIKDALMEFAPTKASVENLTTKERLPVIVLAFMRLELARAAHHADTSDIEHGNEFKFERKSPYDKHMKLYKELSLRYKQLVTNLGIIPRGMRVETDDVYRTNYDGVPTPRSATPSPEVPGIRLIEQGPDWVTIEWDFYPKDHYRAIHIFHSEQSGIYAPHDSSKVSGVPYIISNAERIAEIKDPDRFQVRVEALAAGTHYFLVVHETTAFRFGYSEELVVSIA